MVNERHSQVVSIRLPAGFVKALDAYCRLHHLSRSQACRLAVFAELRHAGLWSAKPVEPTTGGDQ